jgi:hypothetical protein
MLLLEVRNEKGVIITDSIFIGTTRRVSFEQICVNNLGKLKK